MFIGPRGTEAIWKKVGNFTEPNRKLRNVEYSDLTNQALELYSNGQIAQAVPGFTGLLALGEDDFALPESFLGECYFKLGEAAPTVAHFQKAIDIDPHNLEGRIGLYVLYKIQGDSLHQSRMLEEIIALAPWLKGPLESASQ